MLIGGGFEPGSGTDQGPFGLLAPVHPRFRPCGPLRHAAHRPPIWYRRPAFLTQQLGLTDLLQPCVGVFRSRTGTPGAQGVAQSAGPGGLLRLAVPDFEALIKIYQKTGELSRVLGPLYGKMTIQTEQGPATLHHKTTYDQVSLSILLEECGFLGPEHWDWRGTEHASVDDHSQAYFPHMQKDTGILVSLNLQARKPS